MQPNSSDNPYQAPSVGVVTSDPQSDAAFIDGGQSVPAGHGWEWITAGWGHFMQSPLIWVVNIVILIVINIAISLIPLVGSLIGYVLWAVFSGGLMMGCQAQMSGRPLEVGDLFAGFKEKTGSLITVGALYAVAWIAVMIFAGLAAIVFLGASGAIGAIFSGDQTALVSMMGGMSIGFLLIILLVIAAFVPIAMAFWFAAALVALQDVSPTNAIRMSFSACIKNIVPFLLYGLIFFIIGILALIPFGLGWLVVLPLLFTSTYAAYRDIFLAS